MLAVVFFTFTLDQPFHLDTTAYFQSLRDLQSGRITCPFATRCMVSYVMIPFAIFGTHAVKIGFIVAALLFFVTFYLFMARAFSRDAAYLAGLLQLFIPAGLITITHLKEDFVGLTFLSTALLLATWTGIGWRLLSPIAFALSLISKETMAFFAPFYFAVYAYHVFELERPGRPLIRRNRQGWVLLGASVAVSTAVLLVLQPDYVFRVWSLTYSPHLGQYRGPVSTLLPVGIALFREGMGFTVLLQFQVVGVLLLILERDRQRRLLRAIFVASAILVALLTMNITTVQYRHFLVVTFLTLPMAVFLVERFVARRWLYVAGAIALAALAIRMYPAVDFHARYNTQQRFFHGLRGALDENAVLVTTDYSGLARHYLGARTKPHAPDPSDRQAQQFVQEIRDGISHYVLPDAFAYDGYGTFARALRGAFTFAPVYEGWFEDFHPMDYGRRPDELRATLEAQTGCPTSYRPEGTVTIDTLTLNRYRYELGCPGRASELSYLAYRGMVLRDLGRARVYRLVRASGDP